MLYLLIGLQVDTLHIRRFIPILQRFNQHHKTFVGTLVEEIIKMNEITYSQLHELVMRLPARKLTLAYNLLADLTKKGRR